jgi:LysR family transcriptional regulator, low CO2-responsive transcriptional regulator
VLGSTRPVKATALDFDQLNTFAEVAKHGSFTLAARKVFRSQSAVSAQMHKLQQEYGDALFSRAGRTVRLTPGGEALLDYADRLIALRRESLQAVADRSTVPRGVLTIGANEATVLYVLPEVFARFRRLYSDVRISIYRNFSHKVLQRVEDCTIDLGVVTLPVKSLALKVHSIYRDRVMLMVSGKNSLAEQKAVTPRQIAAQSLIFPKTGATRHVLDKFFRPYANKLRIVMELPSITMIKRFVSANLGVSLISEGFASDEVRAGQLKLIPIKDVELWRELGLIYRRDRHLSGPARAFVGVLRGLKNRADQAV